jgi:anthranilate synthase component 1
MVRNYEQIGEARPDEIKIPDMHLLFTKEVIAYDHARQKIKIIVNVPVIADSKKSYEQALLRLMEIKAEIKAMRKEEISLKVKCSKSVNPIIKSNETKKSFMEKVLKAKAFIKNGDVFQVVLSQRLQVETGLPPFEIYRILRGLNPSPYLFYMDFGGYQLIGSSPELLVKTANGKVETCPIAGTRPRGKNEKEDRIFAEGLLKDEKELAEHRMLIDLARNDIGKISEFGTVVLSSLMQVKKYSHVMHIVSNVEGKLKADCNAYDALLACMPAGTVSGAPKKRAMQIIDALEGTKRGAYAGAAGYFSFDGSMDMGITIRTMVLKDGIGYIQAGAGIVADSDPEGEYEETMRKAQALIQTIISAEEDCHDCDHR